VICCRWIEANEQHDALATMPFPVEAVTVAIAGRKAGIL